MAPCPKNSFGGYGGHLLFKILDGNQHALLYHNHHALLDYNQHGLMGHRFCVSSFCSVALVLIFVFFITVMCEVPSVP